MRIDKIKNGLSNGPVSCQVDRLNNKNYLALPKRNSVAVRSFRVFFSN